MSSIDGDTVGDFLDWGIFSMYERLVAEMRAYFWSLVSLNFVIATNLTFRFLDSDFSWAVFVSKLTMLGPSCHHKNASHEAKHCDDYSCFLIDCFLHHYSFKTLLGWVTGDWQVSLRPFSTHYFDQLHLRNFSFANLGDYAVRNQKLLMSAKLAWSPLKVLSQFDSAIAMM